MQTCLSSDILINKGLDRSYSLHPVMELMTEIVIIQMGDKVNDLEATNAVCNYQVMQEVDMHEHQRAGIINLSWVKSICPLAPVFDETCEPNLTSKHCFETICTYH